MCKILEFKLAFSVDCGKHDLIVATCTISSNPAMPAEHVG